MKAADYQTDPDFVALVKLWESEQRAPFVLAGWLEDRGLDSQVEAVLWAVNEEDRRNTSHLCSNRAKVGPVPWQACGGLRSWWIDYPSSDSPDAHNVPEKVFANLQRVAPRGTGRFASFDSFLDAVVALLDSWPAPVPAVEV